MYNYNDAVGFDTFIERENFVLPGKKCDIEVEPGSHFLQWYVFDKTHLWVRSHPAKTG